MIYFGSSDVADMTSRGRLPAEAEDHEAAEPCGDIGVAAAAWGGVVDSGIVPGVVNADGGVVDADGGVVDADGGAVASGVVRVNGGVVEGSSVVSGVVDVGEARSGLAPEFCAEVRGGARLRAHCHTSAHIT